MESVDIKKQGKATKEHLESYLKNEIEWYKFSLIEKGTKLGTFLYVSFFISMFVLLFIFTLSTALALFLGELLANYPLAFLIVSASYLSLAFLIYLFRKNIFSKPLLRTLLKEIK